MSTEHKTTTEVERLRAGAEAAIRAANLALFLLQRHSVPISDSWRAGFERDVATAKEAMGDG